jgi:hypothetical protein
MSRYPVYHRAAVEQAVVDTMRESAERVAIAQKEGGKQRMLDAIDHHKASLDRLHQRLLRSE